MREKRHGRHNAGRLTGLIAALTAAVLLAAVPVAAQSTVTGSDVMIRNSAEEKNGEKNNIIGSLNLGDKVTVKSKTTDASGQEWYLVELPNGNTGYVKSQWVDVDGGSVETQTQTQTQEEQQQSEDTQDASAEDAGQKEDAAPEEAAGEADIDDWTIEDAGSDRDEADGSPETDSDQVQTDSADADDGQETPEVDNGDTYDPFTDPNAQYSINYVTEKDGTGNWYIFNYDTNKRIRLGDLKELSDAQASAQKNASSAGIWRTIACILLILLIALLVFLYLIIRRNSPGGGSAPSRRSRRQRRTVEEDDDDDFYYTGEDSAGDDETGERPVSGAAALKKDVPDGEEEDEEDAPDYDPGEDEDDAGDTDEGPDEDLYDDDFDEELMDDEDENYNDEEDGLPRRGGVFGFFRNFFSRDGLDDDDEEEDGIDDDDFDDDDIDYEEEIEEEDEIPEEIPPVKKTRARGRRPEEEQSSPAPRPRKRPAKNISFDEALDYPEDEELLSAVGKASGKRETAAEAPEIPAEKKAGSPSGESAAQNPVTRRGNASFEEPEEDLYADDDDDMEYSFLNSPARRPSR